MKIIVFVNYNIFILRIFILFKVSISFIYIDLLFINQFRCSCKTKTKNLNAINEFY